MPSITQIKSNAQKFKKVEHRPWDEDGLNSPADHISVNSNSVIQIETSKIKRWKHKDRPENELGDIEALAKEFIQIGQQQPCVVRAIKNSNSFELIIGERRWQAAKFANIKLMAIVSTMSDTDAALAQAAENDSRESLSDYAKGISFAKLIDAGIIKQKDLIDKLGKSKQLISALLSFNKIPQDVILAIGDMQKVSANTAERIKELCNKGEEYKEAIIALADKISTGKFGRHAIEKSIVPLLHNDSKNIPPCNKKFYSSNGTHLFTCKKSDLKPLSITFSQHQQNKINIETLSKKIIGLLENSNMD